MQWLRLAVVLVGLGLMSSVQAQANAREREIVLIGASIGKAWNIDQLPQRAHLSGYRFGYRGVFDFDKSKLVSEVSSGKQRPDYVMIKECSTYFPHDPAHYKKDIPAWVAQLRAAGVRPILVTTAPVGEAQDLISKTKTAIKKLIGRPTWLETVTAYNDWLKDYAAREKIPVFDLEAVLRIDAKDRHLKKEFDQGDLVHLTPQAYQAVDKEFVAFLHKLDS